MFQVYRNLFFKAMGVQSFTKYWNKLVLKERVGFSDGLVMLDLSSLDIKGSDLCHVYLCIPWIYHYVSQSLGTWKTFGE